MESEISSNLRTIVINPLLSKEFALRLEEKLMLQARRSFNNSFEFTAEDIDIEGVFERQGEEDNLEDFGWEAA